MDALKTTAVVFAASVTAGAVALRCQCDSWSCCRPPILPNSLRTIQTPRTRPFSHQHPNGRLCLQQAWTSMPRRLSGISAKLQELEQGRRRSAASLALHCPYCRHNVGALELCRMLPEVGQTQHPVFWVAVDKCWSACMHWATADRWCLCNPLPSLFAFACAMLGYTCRKDRVCSKLLLHLWGRQRTGLFWTLASLLLGQRNRPALCSSKLTL